MANDTAILPTANPSSTSAAPNIPFYENPKFWVPAAAIVTTGILLARREARKVVDEFIRKDCTGVSPEIYKQLFDLMWKHGMYSTVPPQFKPEVVERMRTQCREAGGTPSTVPIPEPQAVETTDEWRAMNPIPNRLPESVFDRLNSWIEENESAFRKTAAITGIGGVLAGLGAIVLSASAAPVAAPTLVAGAIVLFTN